MILVKKKKRTEHDIHKWIKNLKRYFKSNVCVMFGIFKGLPVCSQMKMFEYPQGKMRNPSGFLLPNFSSCQTFVGYLEIADSGNDFKSLVKPRSQVNKICNHVFRTRIRSMFIHWQMTCLLLVKPLIYWLIAPSVQPLWINQWLIIF